MKTGLLNKLFPYITKKQVKQLKRILTALCAFLVVMITDRLILKTFCGSAFPNGIASIIPNGQIGWILTFVLYFSIYIFIGHDVLKEAFENIRNGQMLDENFLMVVASIGAFGLGIYTSITTKGTEIEGFDEGCAVILFYQVGEWFESYAVGKSRKSITSLMDIRPDYANIRKEDGSLEQVDPATVKLNSIIVVLPGEKIPLDGEVINGESVLDTKALTGESAPLEVRPGSSVISGTINIEGTLEIIVEKEFHDSTVSKILDLVENASMQKSKSETFVSKFAKYYTPIVVFSALAVGILPPLVNGFCGNWNTWADWIYRALSFLVVSCPCAVVISVPLTFFAGIGCASKQGVLIKGSIHLERFNQVKTFVFDKTGTLTKGNFEVVGISPEERKDEILKYAAIAELQSSHPIANSIKKAYGGEIDTSYTIENISGKGIVAKGKDTILCGNEKLMEAYGISYEANPGNGTVVYVAVNGQYIGSLVIADEIKPEAKDLISYLAGCGIHTVMLTGDNERIAHHVAGELGLTSYKSSLLPQDKVEEVDRLLKAQQKDEYLCFVGDGINDAPVLMKSDIGIAMGGVGSDAAIEASDIVLMNDDLRKIGTAKRIAKHTMKIVKENVVFALGVKLAILILSVVGVANMWLAVFGDVGVAMIAILNAMRANSKKV